VCDHCAGSRGCSVASTRGSRGRWELPFATALQRDGARCPRPSPLGRAGRGCRLPPPGQAGRISGERERGGRGAAGAGRRGAAGPGRAPRGRPGGRAAALVLGRSGRGGGDRGTASLGGGARPALAEGLERGGCEALGCGFVRRCHPPERGL
jgi:hypothetical protein